MQLIVECIDIKIQTWQHLLLLVTRQIWSWLGLYRVSGHTVSYMTANSNLTPKTITCSPKMPIQTAAVAMSSRKTTRLLKGEEGTMGLGNKLHNFNELYDMVQARTCFPDRMTFWHSINPIYTINIHSVLPLAAKLNIQQECARECLHHRCFCSPLKTSPCFPIFKTIDWKLLGSV